ncbi:MAG TPA: HAMP domain-containing sensor histidine kinase [Bryobacteraceae bacterium]
MIKALALGSSLLTSDAESFKRQEASFAILNLFVLAVLLLTHTLFASYWGSPPKPLIVVLAAGFFIDSALLIWVQTRTSDFSERVITSLTWTSILTNMSLALILAALSNRQDLQYFALLVVPVLQSAFRLPWIATVGVVTVAGLLDFFWVWWYFQSHPPVVMGEYFEAGTISLIYIVMGSLVWLLADNLRRGQQRLEQSLKELERARSRLLQEEKLAAVGRLSSAIAHEVRNPVAMITSSLEATLADDLDDSSRREMLGIAAREAARLEKLTGDFLSYARTDNLSKEPCDLDAVIDYVASVCRPYAARRSIAIAVRKTVGAPLNLDAERMEQALLNLLMNAMDASPDGATVSVSSIRYDGELRVEIENGNGPIPESSVGLLFEPFFTTKPHGTGLGLAISRKIVRAHGGDLTLSANSADAVRFSITLPAEAGSQVVQNEAARG